MRKTSKTARRRGDILTPTQLRDLLIIIGFSDAYTYRRVAELRRERKARYH